MSTWSFPFGWRDTKLSICRSRHKSFSAVDKVWGPSEGEKQVVTSLVWGKGGAVIYGFMEGAPKRRAARATGTTHLTHTMNYYMQWSLAEVLPLKEIKTKQTADSIVSSNTTDAPRKISSDSWTGVETVYSRRKWADGSWLEPHVCSLLLPFL